MMFDLQMAIGLTFLAVLIIAIIYFWAKEIFSDEPYLQIGLIIGEISFVILVIVNLEWLRRISFIFALMIVFLTFFSSVILSKQTIILGIPSMVFFCYSFFLGKSELWISIVTALIFIIGLIVNLHESFPIP